MPPSDILLLAPATAALIIHCYQRHRCHATIRLAATRIQVWFRSAILGVHAAACRHAAHTLQCWIRRTSRRQLFQHVSDALYFQSQDTWGQLAADAADKIAKAMHRQKGKLTCDFITKAMHSWILRLIE